MVRITDVVVHKATAKMIDIYGSRPKVSPSFLKTIKSITKLSNPKRFTGMCNKRNKAKKKYEAAG